MMKRVIHIILFYFVTVGFAFGQSDNVTLNIRLFPVQIIEVNPSQEIIYLDYETTADYANGVQFEQPDHLSMYSTGGFVVKVSSIDVNMTAENGQVIPISDIIITPKQGVLNPLIGAAFSPATLSSEATTIITNNTGGMNKSFGIHYQTKGNNEYVDKYVDTGKPTVFSTNIVYAIEAR
jgi:hypothetical protein